MSNNVEKQAWKIIKEHVGEFNIGEFSVSWVEFVDELEDAIVISIKEAVAAEREACAEIARYKGTWKPLHAERKQICESVAAAIEARREKK